jgi:hypothetical protein
MVLLADCLGLRLIDEKRAWLAGYARSEIFFVNAVG